jgi:hypothetical protein
MSLASRHIEQNLLVCSRWNRQKVKNRKKMKFSQQHCPEGNYIHKQEVQSKGTIRSEHLPGRNLT